MLNVTTSGPTPITSAEVTHSVDSPTAAFVGRACLNRPSLTPEEATALTVVHERLLRMMLLNRHLAYISGAPSGPNYTWPDGYRETRSR